MNKCLVYGNWKMNKNKEQAEALLNQIVRGVERCSGVEVGVFPPFVYLEKAVMIAGNSAVSVGAQNVYYQDRGAYTGEISAVMLRSIGCSHVLVGHSERRMQFHEHHASINKKLKASLKHGLRPVLCVGESLEEKSQARSFEVLNTQLVYALEGIEGSQVQNVIIAYEPVWAIGTGVSAAGEQADSVHRFIKQTIKGFTGQDTAWSIPVIYGGSVTAKNAVEFLGQKDIDGVLVGGASLQAHSFCGIALAASSMYS
ncbi:MAG: triose-phosphate isomerase [Spirochaetota bacterium]